MQATTDITKMSAADLAKALKEKKAAEKAAKANARKSYDELRDSYIDTVFGRMDVLSKELRVFKDESVKLGLELHAKMYETLGREPKDGIDSYTLTSADGLRKVSIERQWRCEYDETSSVAIDTIRAVLREKFEGRNKGMYNIIDSILMKNGKGDYDERLVARLRKHEEAVGDPRFSEALDILAKAYRPTTSQTYIRAYRKNDAGKWVDLVMNWSSM
jgi:hypothetical protein